MFVLLLVCSQLLSADMVTAQQESDEEEARIRAAVVESQRKKQEEEAAAAAAAAAGAQSNPRAEQSRSLPGMITQAELQAMMSEAVKAVSDPMLERMRGIEAENIRNKSSLSRVDGQRRRSNEIGKREGATASMAKQLDFVEDTIAAAMDTRESLLSLVLDKPGNASVSAGTGPLSPSALVCKLSDFPEGRRGLEGLDGMIASLKAKLQELLIVWNAPSYQIAFEAIRGNDNTTGAEAEAAMDMIGKAVSCAEKSVGKQDKRKADRAWGTGAEVREKEQGGWGRSDKKAAPGSDGPAWPTQSGWGSENQWDDTWNRPHPPASPRPVPFDGSAPQSAQDYHASRGIGPDDCAYCRKPGHYKRDCPLAKAATAKGKGGGKGGSFRRW